MLNNTLIDYEQLTYYAGYSHGFYAGSFVMLIINAIIMCSYAK
jgi:hypothetical protein